MIDYAVKEKPYLVEDMQGGPDYIVLKSLDTDGVRIIGSVLGQSIALDYFVSQVISHSYIFNTYIQNGTSSGSFRVKRGSHYRKSGASKRKCRNLRAWSLSKRQLLFCTSLNVLT